jgi:hypothetical protein
MKPGNLLCMVLVLLLGMAVAAPAVTIHTPWEFGPKEANLSQMISAWGFPVDIQPLRHATPLEGLPGGTYSINHYAINPGMHPPLGIYPPVITLPGPGLQPPAEGLQWLIPKKPGDWECDIAFTETSDFDFFKATHMNTIFLATQNQNSASSHYHRSSGLIFDLGRINPLYGGQYIIAFEEGRNRHSFGHLDYHDLVIHIHRLDSGNHVPLPGTLPLAGGGLLCLVILRCCRRGFAWTG